MEVIIIVAISENRVIGRDNALPWTIKEDLARFKELTLGCPCIMGRKTWESLPKRPLPGRANIVVSRTLTELPGASVFPSLEGALAACAGSEKVFICGGASIYRQALPLADRVELTLVRRQIEGDAFFPELDAAEWEEAGVNNFDGFSFIRYNRRAEQEAT
ncbi:MAG: dihydrofolate reductase [Treponema sp.]|nr:dihydrofolate reductase [Treponema sp.]